MLKSASAACAAAIIMLAAQPCLAADDRLGRGMPERSSAAFAGAALKLPLGNRTATPSLRLETGFTHMYRYAGAAGSADVRKVSVFEIGATRAGAPALFLAGQDLGEVRQRLGARGSTGTTLLIVGGVLVAVAIVAVASSGMGDTCPTIEGRRDHCINP